MPSQDDRTVTGGRRFGSTTGSTARCWRRPSPVLLLALAVALLSACVSVSSATVPAPAVTESTRRPAASGAAIEPRTPGGPVQLSRAPAADVPDVLDQLIERGPDAGPRSALRRIAQSGDDRYVSVLIEVLRGSELGIVRLSRAEVLDVLRGVSGESLTGWSDWVTWYAGTELVPPPGFTSWKGRLYAAIDPNFQAFFDDRHPARIRLEEVVWGGVLLDGIPALDQPKNVGASDAVYLEPADLVFGVSINGDQRAYPLRIMDWHEMVNDVVGGVPVSLAYCTLCGAGVLFEARADGRTLTFGSSGFLMRSNKLMYDRASHTLWNQLTGEPVVGPLAATGLRLSILPVVVTTWEAWRARHPDTRVLSLDTGYLRPYQPGAGYGGYFESPSLMFPAALQRDGLDQKERVFALTVGGVPRAYPTKTLAAERVVNDTLNATNVVVIAAGGELSGIGFDRRSGPAAWAAGAEVRAFERGEHLFSPAEDGRTVLDEMGIAWTVTERELVSPNGDALPRLPGHLAYWFGWLNFNPTTTVYGVGG